MAWTTLKSEISQVIKTNGTNDIGGDAFQTELFRMIDNLGEFMPFGGLATPASNPTSLDGNLFYLAVESGVYTNFNSISVRGISFLVWKGGTWTKVDVGAEERAAYPFKTWVDTDISKSVRDSILELQLLEGFDPTRQYGIRALIYHDGSNPDGITFWISDLTENIDYSEIVFGFGDLDFDISTDKSTVYEFTQAGHTIRVKFDLENMPAAVNAPSVLQELNSAVFSNVLFSQAEYEGLKTDTADTKALATTNAADIVVLQDLSVNNIEDIDKLSASGSGKSYEFLTGTTGEFVRIGVSIPSDYKDTVTVRLTATSELTGQIRWQNTSTGADLIPTVTVVWVSDGMGGFYFESEVSASTTVEPSDLFYFCRNTVPLTGNVTVTMTSVSYSETIQEWSLIAKDQIAELQANEAPNNLINTLELDWRGYPAMTSIVVKKDGSGDFLTIQEAINSVTDAAVNNQYDVQVWDDIEITDMTELWIIDTPTIPNSETSNITNSIALFTTKDYVHVRGMGGQRLLKIESPTTLTATSYTRIQVIWPKGNVILSNFKCVIKGGRYAIHQEANGLTTVPDYHATTIMKNVSRIHLGNFESEGYPVGAWASTHAEADGTTSGFKRWDIDGRFISANNTPFYFHSNPDYDEPTELHLINCEIIKAKNFILSEFTPYYADLGSGKKALIEMVGCNFPRFAIQNTIRATEQVLTGADLYLNGGAKLVGHGNSPMLLNEELPRTLYFNAVTAGHDIEITGGTAYVDIFGSEIKKHSGSIDLGGEIWGAKRIEDPNLSLGDSQIFSLPYRLGNCLTANKTLTLTVGGVDYTITFDQNYMTSGGGAYNYNTIPNISGATILATINGLYPSVFQTTVNKLMNGYTFADATESGVNMTTKTISIGSGLVRDITNGLNAWRLCQAGEFAEGIATERINPFSGENYDASEIALINKSLFDAEFIGLTGITAGEYYKCSTDGTFTITAVKADASLIAIDNENLRAI